MHVMKYLAAVGLLLAGGALSLPTNDVDNQDQTNGKANEYPEADCKDAQGGNKPSFPHKPVCGCVKMDVNTYSVYIATNSALQKVTAYSNGGCNPGQNKEYYLGQMGGACHNLADDFPNGAIGSVQFYTPVICEVADLLKDIPEEAKKAAEEILATL